MAASPNYPKQLCHKDMLRQANVERGAGRTLHATICRSRVVEFCCRSTRLAYRELCGVGTQLVFVGSTREIAAMGWQKFRLAYWTGSEIGSDTEGPHIVCAQPSPTQFRLLSGTLYISKHSTSAACLEVAFNSIPIMHIKQNRVI